MKHRRLPALIALVLPALAVAGAAAIAIAAFPRGLLVLPLVALAPSLAWYAVLREGVRRSAGLLVAGLMLAVALALMIVVGPLLGELAVIAALASALAAARAAFATRADLPPAPRPERAVVFWNPKSGGGKAEQANLDEEARRRGIEPVKLEPDDDLEALVREAVAGGADALAAAGGDGTQAIVATAAAEHGLPYARVPAGTRNHFALDLGVDRDDVVDALDALVDGRERRVDLAEVNGKVFVNRGGGAATARGFSRLSPTSRCAPTVRSRPSGPDRPVPAGLDGEAVVLDAPVRFTSRPGALRVRIAPHHPGASPSAGLPDSPTDALRRLIALAAGRER